MHLNDIIKNNKTLNPKLWDNFILKDDVREALVKIANAFLDFSNIEKSQVKDIIFVGSNAGFNWNKKSDIDLHIIIDYNSCENCMFFKVKECIDYIKTNFNQNFDIKIFGIPVELYLQDANEHLDSSSIYSIKNNKWIKKPKIINFDKIDKISVQNKYKDIDKKIKNINTPEELDKIFDKIKKDRKKGLIKNKEGDPSNILFKLLRDNDLIKKLKEKRNKLISDQLSLKNRE